MAWKKNTHNEPGIGNKTADLSAFRIMFICFLLVSLANFALFLWQMKYDDANPIKDATILFNHDKNKKDVSNKKWIPLEIEKTVYTYQGYDIDWLDDSESFWSKISSVFGEFKPFFDLVALRIFGLTTFSPFVFFVIFIGIIEGRRAYKLKSVYFGNISSTQYHIIFKLGFFLVAFICCLYLTVPFGSNLPLDLHIPYGFDFMGMNIYYSSPIFWGVIISCFAFFVMFYMSANFSTNI
jgi:hypothetical protein